MPSMQIDVTNEQTELLPSSRHAAARRKAVNELRSIGGQSSGFSLLLLSVFMLAGFSGVYFNTREWHWGQSVEDLEDSVFGATKSFDVGVDSPESAASSMSFRLEAWNKYTESQGHPGKGYPFVAEGLLIEPHVATTLRVMNTNLTFPKLRWNITQQTNVDGGRFSLQNETDLHTQDMQVLVTSVGAYNVQLTGLDHDSSELFTETTQFLCRYVRRSLRTIDAVDRNAFFDAFEVLMKTPDHEGKAIFGKDFRSLTHFVKLHLANAGDKEVDHIHDGLGFLTQHIALTMEFEEALQVINPAVTIPYWDFAEDRVLVSLDDDSTKKIWELEVWGPDWFGNTSGYRHTVTDGRWAYQEIERNLNISETQAATSNAYGYLRAPWNMNNSPYLTRVHSFCGQQLEVNVHWPSCSHHFDWTFDDDYDTWYKYSWAAPYAPHATVHSMIGGYTNCGNLTDELTSFGVEMPTMGKAMDKLYLDSLTFVKNMYRTGLAQPPKFCSMDTPQTMCHMVCDEKVNNISFVNEFLSSEHSSWFGDWLQSFPDKFKPDVMKIMCNTPWTAGEHMEAASPADVSFWPVHPTLERLFHYKRLVKDFSDTNWKNPNEHLPTKYCVYFESSQCDGHHAEDVTSFKASFINTAGNKVSEYVTNLQLFSMSNPFSYHLHYIYDGFTWDYCKQMTYEFPETYWATRT